MEVSLTKDGELIIKAENSAEITELIAWGEDFFNKKSGTLSISLSVNFDHTIPKKENYFFTLTNNLAE